MSESNKRLFLALTISLAIAFLWQVLFPPALPPKPAPKPPAAASAPAPGPGAGSPAPGAPAPGAAPPSAPTPERPPAPAAPQQLRVDSPHWRAVLTTEGAAVQSFALSHPRFREERGGKTVPVDLVQVQGPPFPLEVDFGAALTVEEPWRVEQAGRHAWRFVKEDARARLTKTLRFDPASYVADLALRVENRGTVPVAERVVVRVHGREGGTAPGMMNPSPRYWRAVCYANGSIQHGEVGDLAKKESSFLGDVRWTGIEDKYFLMAVMAAGDGESRGCTMQVAGGEAGARRLVASMRLAERSLPGGGAAEHAFRVYLGPKVLDVLDAVTIAGKDAKLGEAVDYGWLEFIARPMLWLLKRFQGWVGNWGVAIILLTIVVKLATLYWTQKSMRSMRRMAKLQPELKKLQQKYEKDKERLNKEIWALYKREGVNPLGGCLPMLLQMPIWLALYRTLAGSVELYRSSFALWIDDLAQPDRYFVLPIALGVLSIVQSKLQTTNPNDPQQKMMMWMMPIMFLVFSLFVPSGLTLYWLVNTELTMLHQWLMNRADEAPAAAPAKA